MEPPMVKKSPLDDPENAAHAWARYRQIMRILLSVTIATVLIAVGLLYAYNGAISVHFYIAVALGISFTMLLGGGLMLMSCGVYQLGKTKISNEKYTLLFERSK